MEFGIQSFYKVSSGNKQEVRELHIYVSGLSQRMNYDSALQEKKNCVLIDQSDSAD